jgi:hypothetical protein
MRSFLSSVVALSFLSLAACAVSPAPAGETQPEASASAALVPTAPTAGLARAERTAPEDVARAPVADVGKEREQTWCRGAQGCPLDPIPSVER